MTFVCETAIESLLADGDCDRMKCSRFQNIVPHSSCSKWFWLKLALNLSSQNQHTNLIEDIENFSRICYGRTLIHSANKERVSAISVWCDKNTHCRQPNTANKQIYICLQPKSQNSLCNWQRNLSLESFWVGAATIKNLYSHCRRTGGLVCHLFACLLWVFRSRLAHPQCKNRRSILCIGGLNEHGPHFISPLKKERK